ncbi:MAG: flagellar biosynthetic protein FliR [Planctomycetes bacterium]|nr:flagellar biosynthetic protein FliR [Planctomycetota bacterium]
MEPLPPGTLEAFSLFLARTSALVIASPLFGSGTGFARYRIGLIFSIAFLLYSVCGAPLSHSPEPVEYGCLVLREIFVGLFLAFVLQSVMVSLRLAGEMIGTEMGFNMASLVDPSTGQHTPIITQTYEVFFLLGFLAVNGHHVLLKALEHSFARAPVGVLEFGGNLAWSATELFTHTFGAGVAFAAPVLVLLFMASLLVSLLARMVPQLNVMDVGFSARITVGLLALFAFAPFLAPALEGLYDQFAHGIDGALDALGA